MTSINFVLISSETNNVFFIWLSIILSIISESTVMGKIVELSFSKYYIAYVPLSAVTIIFIRGGNIFGNQNATGASFP